jgi:hypothetical protein
MEASQYEPSHLFELALQQQWPAILLGVAVSAIAWLDRIERIPAALRVRTAWASSPGMLIAAPIYLWGSRSAFESIYVMNSMARSGLASPQSWINYIWPVYYAQFLALLAVLLPGFFTAMVSRVPIKTRDVVGIAWAVGAVALDSLIVLRMVTPVPMR